MENSQLIEGSVADIEEVIERLQTTVIPTLELRVKDLEERVNQLGSDLQGSNNQNTSLSSELNAVKEAVGTQSDHLTGLAANLDELTSKYATLRGEIETTLIALEESVWRIGSSLETVEAENRNIQEDLADLTFSLPLRTNVGEVGMGLETGTAVVGSSENNQTLETNGQLVLLEARLLRLGEKIQEIDTLSLSLADMGEEISELRMELADISSTQGLMLSLIHI